MQRTFRFVVVLVMSLAIVSANSVTIAQDAFDSSSQTGQNDKVVIELGEGQEKLEAAKDKIVAINPISKERVEQILNRLTAKPETAEKKEFNIPISTLAPPLPGQFVKQEFPPKEALPPPPPKPISHALRVTRFSPEGLCHDVKQLSISFSEPMIPISAQESEVQQSALPLKITPAPPGKWHWLGTQTLTFSPAGKHLPEATKYTLTVNRGTQSQLGNKLDEAVSWSITTPAVGLRSFYPANNSRGQKLDPVMLAVFDQQIHDTQALKEFFVSHGSEQFETRLATPEEIKADKQISAMIQSSGKDRCLAFKSIKSLEKDETISVEVKPGIESVEGPQLSLVDRKFRFVTYGPFNPITPNQSALPYQPLSIRFTNPINQESFKDSMVWVEPKVENTSMSAWGNNLNINGEWPQNKTLKVHLSPAIQDTFGQKLGTERVISIDVGAGIPQLNDPYRPFEVLPPTKKHLFSFVSRYMSKARVVVYKASPEQYLDYQKANAVYRQWHKNASDYPDNLEGFEKIDTKVISIDGGDHYVETPIGLEDYLNKSGSGSVILTVEQWPRMDKEVHRFPIWVQCTNIGLSSINDHSKMLVLATKLTDGSPIKGAEISTSYGAKYKTNDSGIVTIPCAGSNSGFFVCRSGSDQSFFPSLMPRKVEQIDSMRWYCVTDRNLYKPGETVQVKGFVRRFGAGVNGDISLLKKDVGQLSFVVKDGRYLELEKGKCSVDDLGGFTFSFTVPQNANLGAGSIELTPAEDRTPFLNESSHTCSFVIDEFRRPEFELSLKSSAGASMMLGDKTNITLKAKYFAGGALQAVPIKWSVSSRSATFAPPGWSAYTFGIKQGFSYPFFGFGGGGSYSSDINAKYLNYAATTDSAGKHVLAARVKALAEPTPITLSAEASVTDLSRQVWTEKTSILVHPAQVYVGLRMDKQFYHAGDTLQIGSVVVDWDGKPVAGSSVHFEVFNDKHELKDGRYVDKEEKVAETEMVSDLLPKSWQVHTEDGGSMKLVAIVKDARGQESKSEVSFWTQEEPKHHEDKLAEQGQLIVVADKTKYQPGETAEFMVQSPFPSGRGMVCVNHQGMQSSFPFEMENSSASFKLPISEDMMTDFSVEVKLLGSDYAVATGVAYVEVPPDRRRLEISVLPASKNYAPGETASVEVQVKDHEGKPAANTELALAVVDESVLALTAYNWNDPCTAFYPTNLERYQGYGPYWSGSRLVEQDLRSHVVLPSIKSSPILGNLAAPYPTRQAHSGAGGSGGAGHEHYAHFEPGYLAGGSLAPMSIAADALTPMEGASFGTAIGAQLQGATNGTIGPQGEDAEELRNSNAAIALRSDFSAVAYFNSCLVTDSNGKASCQFKLPDNLTRYRILAVGACGEKLFGKGESSLTAKLPLLVRPSLPRFLNFGDNCALPVLLQNQTDKEIEVDLAIRSSNLSFGSKDGNNSDPGTQHLAGGSLHVPANDRVEVTFPASTEDPGTASVDIVAVSGQMSDAAAVSLPVYTPFTSHAFATYGQIVEGAQQQIVDIPKDVCQQIGGLELSTSSTALQALTDAYIYLSHYEFECSEQISSRVLATNALSEVLSAFNKMSKEEQAKVQAKTQADIDILCRRQNGDGSFGLWRAGESDIWPFVSIQVTRALIQSKEKKFVVPEDVLNRAKNYLRTIENVLRLNHYSKDSQRSIIAYALFVRHLMKEDDTPHVRQLISAALKAYDDSPAKIRLENNSKEGAAAGTDRVKLPAEMSLEAMGWLLPVISSDPDSAKQKDLLRSIISSHIVETSSTADVQDAGYGDNSYYLFYSHSRLNAVILEALLLDQPDSQLIPKLAKGLLAYRKAGRWDGTQENSACLLALNRYFHQFEKDTPDFVVRTWLGNQFVGETKFEGRSTDTVQTDIPMSYLVSLPQDKNVLIGKTGKGRLYYRLALNYAPKSLALPAFDSGFKLKRTYEGVDDPRDVSKDEHGIWHFKAGAVVKSKLEFSIDSSRYHVALTDPIPAGAEPINMELKGSSDELMKKAEEEPTTDDGHYASLRWMWWRPIWYEHQNLRDFRAEAFASSIGGGTYKYSYLMRATTPGKYLIPPAKIEEMYAPETFGRAASEQVVIESEEYKP